MDLFKKRLKEACLFILFCMLVAGVSILFIVLNLRIPVVGTILFLLVSVVALIGLGHMLLKGIYWLLIEPFILAKKNKKSRRG